ncbi:MAG: protein kinase [Sandaracinaceae bacterium]
MALEGSDRGPRWLESTRPEIASAIRGGDDDDEWVPDIGDRIAGSFVLERLLGTGGLGLVFVARDLALGRRVALKMLRPEMSAHPTICDAFVQEARRLASLRHRRIVTVHACGKHRGHPYVVMELIDGSDALRRIGAMDGRLGLREALAIVMAIAEGLDALHEKGIVHGDVKPSNVLLGRTGKVKLTDVGVAVGLGPDGALRGTPAYLAPEQILGVVESGEAADVYSLAVSAFELFTGQLPFQQRGAALIAAHVYEPVPSASALRPELGAAFDAAIAKGLAKLPADRPTAGGLARALAEAIAPDERASSVRSMRLPPLRRVLIADDDAELRQLFSLAIVHAIGTCAVEAVSSGEAALAAAAHRMPDAIALDLQMPGRSTLDITREIRALPGGDRVPLVIITGSGSAADWRDLRRAGADACLLKPFDVEDLLDALRRAQRRSTPL